jgi:rhamnosyltransferase
MVLPEPKNSVLIIPTYNAGPFAAPLVAAIQSQTFMPTRWLVIDSSSKDKTVDIFKSAGAEILVIDPAQFDHGGTRQMAAELCSDREFLIYLTHDAIPASPDAFSKLLAGFSIGEVGLCYGRQLPRPRAEPIEAQARLFNYPEESSSTTPETARGEGARATFCSNSFSAYRASALHEVGGFPSGTIFGEDAIVAGRLLLAGWTKSYRADAEVIHSHDYSIVEEAKRYFDLGVLHAREPWIRDSFGAAEGAGFKFLRAQMYFLAAHAPWLIPAAFIRAAGKYAMYRLGISEARLPLKMKRQLSMNARFWRA